jgi:penicillin-binding protein 1C
MKRVRHIHKTVRKHPIRTFFIASFIVGGFIFLWLANFRLPDFNSFDERKVSSSTKIYDRTGKVLLYDVHQGVRRTTVPWSDISVYAKNATVAIEDSEFYQHKGIKPTAILRAILVNIFSGGYSQGGSTITQQVVKNAILTPNKSISRKLKEWVLSLKLEQIMSKEEILSLYLNEAPYGGTVYGIEEASKLYFGVSAKDLTLNQAAYLAALPQAPTFYSPYGNNREKLETRKNYVLKRMFDLGFINQGEYASAKEETAVFLPGSDNNSKAMHFVFFVREYLEQKYGLDMLESGGLKIITTLDYNLQAKAEDIVKKTAPKNEKNFNATNASMVAIDPRTGQILVMVGSRDYFDKEIDGNFNVAIAHRQPGSSFKPFVYATAFGKGYTPETILFDVKTEFQTTCTADGKPLYGTKAKDCYQPKNFDDKYLGPMTIKDALAQSRNIPAIKALYLAGIPDSLATARAMGIKSLSSDPNQYGLTLVLGGGEVSLLDMTSAYSVFANNGVRNPYQSILRVEDMQGQVLEEFRDTGSTAIPKDIALQISDILSDNKARAPEFGEHSALYVEGRGDVASKTGTTNDYRDAWILGYTPSLAVGVWAGNNDNSPMQKKIAGFIVAPMWHEFMVFALSSSTPEHFEKPKPVDGTLKPVLRGIWQGGETFIVDKISGGLATEFTPNETKEERVIKDAHSILYWVSKNDPLGPKPGNPDNDPQFRLWEPAVLKWVNNNQSLVNGYTRESIPSYFDNVHTSQSAPIIQIVEPSSFKNYQVGEKINTEIRISSNLSVTRVDYFLNNTFLGSSSGTFGFSFIPKESDITSTNNNFRVVVYDSAFNKTSSSQTISFGF